MSQRIHTYEDYCRLDDDRRYEIINGVIYLMSAPSRRHQGILVELSFQIRSHLQGNLCKMYVAPFDVRLPLAGENADKPRNVVQPDLVVVCDMSKLDDAGCNGAPDLVVEILSPTTAAYDTLHKKELYEKAGVAEYWVVDPAKQQVYVLCLNNGRYADVVTVDKDESLASAVFPDLVIDLQSVFSE